MADTVRVERLPSPTALRETAFPHPFTPNASSAYYICQEAERVLEDQLAGDESRQSTDEIRTKLIKIRIVGHLLCHAPNQRTTVHIASKVVSSSQDVDALVILGEWYEQHLLHLFRKFKGRTPPASAHPSRPSFEVAAENAAGLAQATPSNYSNAWPLVLLRDNHRCMLTRKVHKSVYPKFSEVPPNTFLSEIQCAYILPHSINQDLDKPDKAQYTARVWTVLKEIGYTNLSDLLSGQGIYSLENLLTLEPNVHTEFDTLSLWLEPVTGTSNCYRIGSIYPITAWQISDEYVTFKSNVAGLPLPDPDLLNLHATCCKVAHLSGASEMYSELERDLELDPNASVDVAGFTRALKARLYCAKYFLL
ncbi:hypothetical protein OBBRIDRAFT_772567 [Obba rivulosa]|uniref:HNH nuclease domain-containing protein n=1 Tax=Obba rivulosa TaxID=1052685 RepID=A0A8E2DLU5_9APHY|nr:hypothetical protein OBBRIDRAFT_772567 [Obba rivulosa]